MSTITNNLNALGRIHINANIMSKIFISLSKTWEENVIAIQKAKDLTKL
jgi:hypothetical protein